MGFTPAVQGPRESTSCLEGIHLASCSSEEIRGADLLAWRHQLLAEGGRAVDLDWLLDLGGGLPWQQLQALRLHPERTVTLQSSRQRLGDLWRRHMHRAEPLQYLVGRCPWRDLELTVAPGVRPPTGIYDKNRLLNTGRNYWAFDNTVAYTWLHAKRGHEVSLSLGYIFNTTNPVTKYTTGNEFHLDWLVGQHFNERRFGVGATGYWYIQTTNDQGPLPGRLRPDKFDAQGVGVGAAVLWTPKVFGKDVNLIAKWIHDLYTKRRFEGDLFMISVALKVL